MSYNLNATVLANPDVYCTLTTCPLSLAHLSYLPSLPGNALYAALFSLLLVAQIGLGIRYRIWGFLCGMLGGIILEMLGYVFRIMMHSNPFTQGPFLG